MSQRSRKFGSRLSVSLTAPHYEKLHHIAEVSDVSVAWLVRRAIEDYLAQTPELDEPHLPFGGVQGPRHAA